MKTNRTTRRKKKPNRPFGRGPMGRNRNSKKVSQPTAKSKQIRVGPGLKTLTFSHKEFVRDLYAPPETTNQIFRINPGINISFPWLANVANNFETFRFTKLWFEYVPNVGTNTDGALTIAPDYDAADDNSDVSKTVLFSFEDTFRTPLWEGGYMKCSPKNLSKMKTYFVRNGSLSQNLDIKTYDPLQLIVLITGQTDVVVGELWVHYTIRLDTPQIQAQEPASMNILGQAISYNVTTPFSGVDPKQLYGTLGKTLKLIKESDTKLGFKTAGKFLVNLYSDYLQDSSMGDPIPHPLNPGAKFEDPITLKEIVHTDVEYPHYHQYAETLLLKLDEEAEGYPGGDGIDLSWQGWNKNGSAPYSAEYSLNIDTITDEMYDRLAAAAKKSLTGIKRRNKLLEQRELDHTLRDIERATQEKRDNEKKLASVSHSSV